MPEAPPVGASVAFVGTCGLVDVGHGDGTVGVVEATAARQERAEVVTTLCLTRLRVPALVERVPQRATIVSYVGTVLDRLISEVVAGRRAGVAAEISELRGTVAQLDAHSPALDGALERAASVSAAAFG